MESRKQSIWFSKLAARICLTVLGGGLVGSALFVKSKAQSTTATPAYYLAVIKPNKTGAFDTDIAFSNHGTFTATNVTVKELIEAAFHMRHDLAIDMPKWAQEEHFDIEAKMVGANKDSDAELTDQQRDHILEALLIDRFKLKVHNETRVLQLYELVVDKNGMKMITVDASMSGQSSVRGVKGNLRGLAATMDLFAFVLSNDLSVPVLNKTALTGSYDFTLKWNRGEASMTDGPLSIFTAAQEQLGLKLLRARRPVQVLIIDEVERPSEN